MASPSFPSAAKWFHERVLEEFAVFFEIDDDIRAVAAKLTTVFHTKMSEAEKETEEAVGEVEALTVKLEEAEKERDRAKAELTDAMAEIEMLKRQPEKTKKTKKTVETVDVPEHLTVKGAPTLTFTNTRLANEAKKYAAELGAVLVDGETVFRNAKKGLTYTAVVFNFTTHLEFRSALGTFHNANLFTNACLADTRVRDGKTGLSNPSENGYIKCHVVRDGKDVHLRDLIEDDKMREAREKAAEARRALMAMKKAKAMGEEPKKKSVKALPSADSDSRSEEEEEAPKPKPKPVAKGIVPTVASVKPANGGAGREPESDSDESESEEED
jgi:hypothetical protein